MAIELGAAYISILPETSKLASGIKSSLGDAEKASVTTGKKMGSNIAGGLKKSMAGLAGLGVGLGAAIGLGSLVKEAGNAADAIEKFKSTMDFAGFSTKEIDRALASTTDYANKTVYELADVQNLTAQLAANGVKDYDKLAKAAGNLNAVAGGNAETYKSVGMVMSQTAGAGKLTTENWNQLADAIPGASGVLQKALRKNGAFTGDFRTAMAEGQITAEEFNKAISETGNSPAAKKAATSTKTFEGAIGALKASVVTALLPAMTALQPAFSRFAAFVGERIIPAVSSFVGLIISKVVPAVKSMAGFIKENSDYLIAIAAAVGTALVALGAYNAYVKITTAVTKAWAVVQKVLNGSLKANPIGIVITVLALLVGALVLAYKKSDTFRRIVNSAWAGIKKAIGAAWAFIKPVFKALGDFIVNVLGPVIKGWFNNVVKPYFALVGKIISAAWNNVIKPVFKALANFITNTVVPAFKKGVNKIGDIWDGLKSAARKPVEFLVNTVYNDGIRKMMNYIPGVSLPSASFARGGVLPGYTPGRDVHSFYSPTAGRLNLSGGEGIMRPEFVRAVGGKKGIDRLNAAARRGMSFFAGGVLPLLGGSVSVHGSGYSGYAADLNYPGYSDYGKPVGAWKAGTVAQMNYIGDRSYGRWVVLNHGSQSSLYAHLSRFGNIGIGSKVGAGQTIGYVGDIGNTGNPPTSHLHFEINGGGAAAGTANYGGPTPEQQAKAKWSNVLTKVPEAAKSVWNSIKGMGGSEWFTTMKGAATAVFKQAVGWIDDKIPNKFLPDTPVASALKKFGIFDNGGILAPGGLAYNASSKPEAVFNHKQFKAYAQGGGSRNAFPRKLTLVVNDQQFDAYVRDTARDEIGAEETYNNNRWRAYN